MPLTQGKSPKAFAHNIKAELGAGKPKAQALAIAYAVKRKNAKKMAAGGMVESADELVPNESGISDDVNEDFHPSHKPSLDEADLKEHYVEEHETKDEEPMKFAHGGMMDPTSLAKAAMAKRFAKGGVVEAKYDTPEEHSSEQDMDMHSDDMKNWLADDHHTPTNGSEFGKESMVSEDMKMDREDSDAKKKRIMKIMSMLHKA